MTAHHLADNRGLAPPTLWQTSCILMQARSMSERTVDAHTAMTFNRCWREIVLIGTGVACALALLMATLGAAAAVFERPEGEQSYEGMVTCSRCGARHAAKPGATAAECTFACVHGGAQFALVDGDKAYLLEGDVSSLKPVVGQRASVTGVLTGNTIHLSSVTAGR